MLLSKEEIERRENYNATIGDIHDTLKGVTVNPHKIIVKLYYYVSETVTENGIIEPKYVQGTTEGGKPTAYMDTSDFQPRGIVVHIGSEVATSDKYKDLSPGDEVWINYRTLNTPGTDLAIRLLILCT